MLALPEHNLEQLDSESYEDVSLTTADRTKSEQEECLDRSKTGIQDGLPNVLKRKDPFIGKPLILIYLRIRFAKISLVYLSFVL